jgi:hypothetical protein
MLSFIDSRLVQRTAPAWVRFAMQPAAGKTRGRIRRTTAASVPVLLGPSEPGEGRAGRHGVGSHLRAAASAPSIIAEGLSFPRREGGRRQRSALGVYCLGSSIGRRPHVAPGRA